MNDPVCLADFESRAEARLPGDVWDFIAGGSGAEITLAANRTALDAVALLPRVLSSAGVVDTSCQLLKSEASLPVVTAPMAYQRLVHPDGELALAAAARDTGIPFVASTYSSVPIEELAEVGGTVWFQVYWLHQRSLVDGLITRAEESGCKALMVTVDVPVLGRRLRDLRNDFRLPAGVVAANLPAALHTQEILVPAALTWPDVEWIRDRTTLPVVVKGILDPRDALRAVSAGADAVVVSNHGGRQLDGAAASVAALPAVVEAVGARSEVLLDSGIRSGTDVLRALALGASGVLVGRPLLWGLAVDGAEGAARVLTLLKAELHDALTLAGCLSPAAARTLAVL
ncbi:MAG TPA: alpha-hydroxy acid oxidase [Actinophytocola sp.]|uniref:alpha-hydroxy acid oxidase n=1 Tax=Actinophytocola sp. TaxID=1872138 RepID=UPI002DB58DD9|nr:alpha-hydroxy acid oxidase [Actinophytocola sp.]HEU5471446.1 alpha-hydroxy acid oxidase [Actinophytocola sp.]